MKILLLTTFEISKNKLAIENCKSQYHMFLYFIFKELSKYNHDISIQHIGPTGSSSRIKKIHNTLKIKEADHCIVVDNRGIFKRPQIFIDKIRENIKGCVATLSASNSIVGQENVLFYLVPAGKRRKFKCRYIGWACDHDLLYPHQNKNKINILIDHPYYSEGRIKDLDKTLEISKQAVEYFNGSASIRRLCAGGVETVDTNNFDKIEKYEQGKGLAYNDACEEYGNADIYFVTHPECMGLVVLECAMSGALIVAPKGFIKTELLKSLNHIVFENNDIPWDDIIKRIDHNKSRKLAFRFNWVKSCRIINDTFTNWDKYKSNLVFRNCH
jgi:hypothetical protein